MTENEKRHAIIAYCREMNVNGLNRGTAGNISMRHGEGMLISPTGMAYEALEADDIVEVDGRLQANGGFIWRSCGSVPISMR